MDDPFADASDPFGASADDLVGALVIDVRRADTFERATSVIPGSQWRDPATVSQWAIDLPLDREWVVYCVHGHEVSRATAQSLREAGLKARYLRGGIARWEAQGHVLQAKAPGPATPPART